VSPYHSLSHQCIPHQSHQNHDVYLVVQKLNSLPKLLKKKENKLLCIIIFFFKKKKEKPTTTKNKKGQTLNES